MAINYVIGKKKLKTKFKKVKIIQKEESVDKFKLIYEKYDDWDLFRYYFGEFKTKKSYSSPLRNDDSPSLSFYINNRSQPRAKDLAFGKVYSPIDYVQELYGLTFQQALDKICSDFGILDINFKSDIYKVSKKEKEKIIKESLPSNIKSSVKEFTKEELQYWFEYGTEKFETLRFFDIFSTNRFWINLVPMICSKPTFTYFFKKSNHIKIYQPLANKENKWYSNSNNLEDIQGYYQANIKVNKPKLLLLVASMKEVTFLYERGITAMAAHNECANLDPDFIRHLRKYCGVVMSLFDFDKAGIEGSEKLKKDFDIDYFTKPEYFTSPEKDLTDYWKYGNKEELNQFIQEIKEYDK